MKISGLIFFRMDWLDLLQESSPTPQFKSINSLALSFLYSPTLTSIHDYWKTIVLPIWIFAGKVIMSLLFNMPSLLVITFFSKEQASFNFMAAVTIWSDFGGPQNKLCHSFHCFPIIFHEVMGLDAMILVF